MQATLCKLLSYELKLSRMQLAMFLLLLKKSPNWKRAKVQLKRNARSEQLMILSMRR